MKRQYFQVQMAFHHVLNIASSVLCKCYTYLNCKHCWWHQHCVWSVADAVPCRYHDRWDCVRCSATWHQYHDVWINLSMTPTYLCGICDMAYVYPFTPPTLRSLPHHQLKHTTGLIPCQIQPGCEELWHPHRQVAQ